MNAFIEGVMGFFLTVLAGVILFFALFGPVILGAITVDHYGEFAGIVAVFLGYAVVFGIANTLK